MEITGKLNPSALHSMQFGTCQDVIEELFKGCFHNITLVSIGKGTVSELDESLLTITSAKVDDITNKWLQQGLATFFEGSFTIVYTGEDPLIPKDGCGDFILEHIETRLRNRAAAQQSEIDRANYVPDYSESEDYISQDEAHWYAD